MKTRFLRFSFAVGLCLSLRGAPAQDVDSELRQHFQAARQAQDAGDLNTAVQEYTAVLHLQPDIPEVYANLGLVYFRQAKFENSAGVLEKAVALKPGLRGTDLFLGIDYLKLYRPQRALPHLKKAAELEPQNKEVRSWLCHGLWDAGQTAQALQQLRQAVKDFPEDSEFLFLLGEGYRKSANREVEKVVASTPATTPFYHQVFGDIYTVQRNWDRAIAHYRRALELDARWAGAHYGLGEVYFQQNRLDEAQAEFQQELNVNPGAGNAQAKLAEIALLRGHRANEPSTRPSAPRLESSAAKLVSLLAAEPNDLKARYLLGMTYQDLSFAVLSQLLAKDPDSYRAHQLQAQTYEYRDENEKALAEYRIVEKSHPELPGLHFAMGHLLWKSGQPEQAFAELQRELQLNPDHAEANAEAGAILVARHEPDQAIPYLRKALELKPDLVMVHEQLGKAFYRRKEFAKALQELKQGLPADDDGRIHYLLGEVYRDMGRGEESRAAMEESRKIKAERLANVNIEKTEESNL